MKKILLLFIFVLTTSLPFLGGTSGCGSGTGSGTPEGDLLVCGNNSLETGEDCDDGNLIEGDTCSSTCHIILDQSLSCDAGFIALDDICVPDGDGDAVIDANDNCTAVANTLQTDTDSDGVGDSCDNCSDDLNPDQADGDSDGIGDSCDNCAADANTDQLDTDSDSIGEVCDNCPDDSNQSQSDADNDQIGDTCDGSDMDGDGVVDSTDNCPANTNANQADDDNDGIGNTCDNCPNNSNADQLNSDGAADGGNACDTDDDNDASLDVNDCAPTNANAHPGATETVGNAIDDDCNGYIDEGTFQYYQTLFTARCSSCHGMTWGTYVNIYNKKGSSPLPTNQYLIKAGHPESSYLYAKMVGGGASLGGTPGIMPPSNVLTQAERTAIALWIKLGALNN